MKKEDNNQGNFKEIKINEEIKGYKIIGLLGKGNFGNVYKVLKQNQLYALKMMYKDKIKSMNLLFYVKTEIKIMKQLNNEHCLKLYDNFVTKHFYCMVLEYCDNGNLMSYIKQNKPNYRECLDIFIQILKGFKAIHELKYMHRDIKAENILKSQNTYKIADFGFATMKEIGQTYCGTSYYMSPEILQKQLHDHKSDLWSLAVMLFFMIFRTYPFDSKEQQLEEIKRQCIPQFNLKKCLEEKNIFNIEYAPELCELFQNIFVFDNKFRYNFSYLFNNCSIIKRHMNKTILKNSINFYDQLEQELQENKNQKQDDKLKLDPNQQYNFISLQSQKINIVESEHNFDEFQEDQNTEINFNQQNALYNTNINQNNAIQQQKLDKFNNDNSQFEALDQFIPIENEGSIKKFYYFEVSDQNKLTLYNNDQKQNSQGNFKQSISNDKNFRGPIMNKIKQCSIIGVGSQSQEAQQINKNNADQNINNQQQYNNIMNVEPQISNHENENNQLQTGQQSYKLQNYQQYSDKQQKNDINPQNDEKPVDQYNEKQLYQKQTSQLRLKMLMGENSTKGQEKQFEQILNKYNYLKQKYSFIIDIIDCLPSLQLTDDLKNIVAYIMLKETIFYAKEALRTLENKQNEYQLEYFDQFLESPLCTELKDEIQNDISRHQRRMCLIYFSINLKEVDKIHPQLKNIFTQNVNETNYDTQLKKQIRWGLYPIFLKAKQMGIQKYEKEKKELIQIEQHEEISNNALLTEEADDKIKTSVRSSSKSIKTNKTYAEHKKIGYRNEKRYSKQIINSYSYLIPGLGILMCMVLNNIFEKANIFDTFSIYFKTHKKKLNKFDFWQFFQWMEQTEGQNLIDQIDKIVQIVFGNQTSSPGSQ
ncbi:Protein kinase-like domain [Pseudocohnilembus persalinus]|uniref:Protein kinase-like domain n=1 Tax=Pseudocohnilembus persalinus TaxID=266149 RepID=A0A0V0QM65_PSEPJ|nr:Protein kinase-like domain [Pseudocohnilembus persalinus]|eukprot:KRX03239.1 Protein kinase-like domain [Pseudocohnilembus persalinus]